MKAIAAPLQMGDYILHDLVTNEDSAVQGINKYLRSLALPLLPNMVQIGGPLANIESGKFQGPINKRLRKWLVTLGVESSNIPKDFTSKVGDIIAPFVIRSGIKVEITDQFDWDAGDFGDQGSCFWSERKECREFMPDWGCKAALFYVPEYDYKDAKGREQTSWIGAGRCWLYPVNYKEAILSKGPRNMLYGDEAGNPNVWLAFNFYGLTMERATNLLGHLFGWEKPQEVEFACKGSMYVNNGKAYMFNEPLDIYRVASMMGTDCWTCTRCDRKYYDPKNGVTFPYGKFYCPDCRPRLECCECHKPVWEISAIDHNGAKYCPPCNDRRALLLSAAIAPKLPDVFQVAKPLNPRPHRAGTFGEWAEQPATNGTIENPLQTITIGNTNIIETLADFLETHNTTLDVILEEAETEDGL